MQITERHVGGVSILDVDGRMTRNDGVGPTERIRELLSVAKLDRVFEVDNEADASVSDGSVKKQVTSLLADGYRGLLLNLSDVPYMDSTSVGELVSAFITVRNNDGVLKLVGPTERIRELLSVAKLDRVFEVYDNEADAVQSFSSP